MNDTITIDLTEGRNPKWNNENSFTCIMICIVLSSIKSYLIDQMMIL
jgi:hypothetical protein